MSNSIYVSVPSVEDQEIFNMAEQMFDEADNPDSIHLGICHSIPFNNKKIINEISSKISRKNISQTFINFYRNMGVGYGRKKVIEMYSGQNYFLQIDSHTNFSKSWDKKTIDLYESAPESMKMEKHIITAYLPGYKIVENNNRINVDDGVPRYSCFLSKNNIGKDQGLDNISIDRDYNYLSIPRWITPRSMSESDKKPHPFFIEESESSHNFLAEGYNYSRKLNANFVFSDYRLVEDYSKIYLWEYLFLEEEFVASIEAYDLGYSIIFPNKKLPLAHLYVNCYNEFYGDESRKSINPDNERMTQAKKRIDDYLSSPKNQEKILKYCNYSGLTYPEFESVDTFYIPGGTP
jgi:hypothetical protein